MRHGKAPFAMALRKLLWQEKFDVLAFALPASVQEDTQEAVEALPAIQTVVVRVDGSVRAYLPMDPCDAYIEALRQAKQRRIPIQFLEDDSLLEGPFLQPLPDAYLVHGLGLVEYYSLAKTILNGKEKDDRLEHRSLRTFAHLQQLESHYSRILFLCDFPLLIAIEELYRAGSRPKTLPPSQDSLVEVKIFPIKPGQLYFALGELPFYAGEMEKERQNPMSLPMDYLDLVKKIFIETRNQFLSDKQDANAVSVKKIQSALIFLRNLTVQQRRLTPDLLDIVAAAKGVFGNSFAAKVMEAGRFYPFFDPMESSQEQLEVGRDHILPPGENDPVEAFNLLEDEPKVWKTLTLKKDPDPKRQRQYRYNWDARGMCSHTPEDDRIEGFNQAIRRRSQDLDLQAFARTEKLSSSLKDGIDMRETLRNWNTGNIYVKEIPPAKGRMDTVVILFDEGRDERYPSRTTWYAEHAEESTLTFYATDPLAKLIGPGISEAEYGGLSLLFPPRPVADVFTLPAREFGFHNLAEQLLYGALLNSREKSLAYVSLVKPGLRMKNMAKQFHRRLVWVPMASFSAETLLRLRKFHILNGKQVRAWASRFIPE